MCVCVCTHTHTCAASNYSPNRFASLGSPDFLQNFRDGYGAEASCPGQWQARRGPGAFIGRPGRPRFSLPRAFRQGCVRGSHTVRLEEPPQSETCRLYLCEEVATCSLKVQWLVRLAGVESYLPDSFDIQALANSGICRGPDRYQSQSAGLHPCWAPAPRLCARFWRLPLSLPRAGPSGQGISSLGSAHWPRSS